MRENKVKTLSEICQEHIDSLTLEEREKEYLFLLEQQQFWKDYSTRQKELREKFGELVSEFAGRFFSAVPGDKFTITINFD